MRIHYLQHVPFEMPAYIAKWAHSKGHTFTGTHLYNYEALPPVEQIDWLIIMGGPMNIYQETEYPWLAVEKQFIRAAIDAGKIVLGICLGAQLIADVLGGKVTKNPEAEIGWLPVTLNEAACRLPLFKNFSVETLVFQWHNDTFSTLGSGTECIAGSEACTHQAFIYQECVIGFQFHLESTAESILALLHHCKDEIKPGRYVQTAEKIQSGLRFVATANALMAEFLDQLEIYDARRGERDGNNPVYQTNLSGPNKD